MSGAMDLLIVRERGFLILPWVSDVASTIEGAVL